MKKKILICLCLISFALLLFFVAPQETFARFGGSHGGGSFHGGSSFSRGGSYSNTHSYFYQHPIRSWGMRGWSSFFFNNILLILLPAFGLYKFLFNKGIGRGPRVSKEINKTFRGLFMNFQEAWSMNNLTPIKDKMSTSLYKKNSQIIEEYKKDHKYNKLEDIKIFSVTEVRSFSDTMLVLRVDAAMKDYFISDSDPTEQIEEAKKQAKRERFSEEWTLAKEAGNWIVLDIH
ncbi:hypothetical protein [Enterococcus sp. JM9B]|uniref:hypothetical protein n=1 Tax=Enterococcus sp. JM9B TaxID=1857216 RepID=UPI0013752AA6|nr:hypothetical protein [Enterococcus sp. JM9B]KAF1301803.1 hypothetical protein BAU16_07900 [Enterococcus sp. JM9B]